MIYYKILSKQDLTEDLFLFVVKLWATNMEHSVSTLEAKANVCCVKFNPESRYHLAFGSAGMLVTIWTCHV